jgi:predicted permease
LGWLFSRRRKREELDEEIRFHLEAERDERELAGESAAEARRSARIDFGNPELAREDARAAWGWIAIEQCVQDLRYVARIMRRAPGFTALAVLSLALGIGANTAIFSFADAMLIRPLPVHDPDTLVRMTWRTPRNEMHGTSRHDSSFRDPDVGFTAGVFSYSAFLEFQKHSDLFASVFAYQGTGPLSMSVHGQAEPVSGEYVSGEYFRGLGVAPLAGRFIDATDDRHGAPAVAVLSAAFVRARFENASDAIGRVATINTTPFTIVGVAAPGFYGTDPGKVIDVYVPLLANTVLQPGASTAAQFSDPSRWWLEIMARRQPAVSLARVQAELAPPFQRTSADLTARGRWTQAPSLHVRPGDDGIDGLRRAYGRPLVMLMALSALILALSCANVASLLLARATARRREIAVRLSIGAGRARVVRQLVTESLALSFVGGALGVGVAIWTQQWVTALVTTHGLAPFAVHADLDATVIAVAIGLSVLTGLLFGLAPALQATGGATMPALREARAQTSYGWRTAKGRRVLLVAQVAITLVMLVSAGLFGRTLSNYRAIDVGYSTDHLLTFALRTAQAGLDDDEAIALFRRLRDQLAALPGATSVGLSDSVLIGDGRSFTTVEPVGRGASESSVVLSVGGGLFSAMQLRVVKGRGIEERDDRPGALPVAVVDETYAHRYLSGQEPLGQYLHVPLEPKVSTLRFQVVGVAADARIGRLTGNREPTVYFPFSVGLFGGVDHTVFVIRTAGDPLTLSGAVRTVVHEANPNVPVARLATQEHLLEGTLNREILLAKLCTALAFLALTIAAVGLYGTVLQDVSRRRSEIGIRMALGAQRSQVIVMVLREVLAVVAIGIAIGVPAAASATGIAQAVLFGVTRSDPLTLTLATSLLVTTALVAGFAPACAAARVNPTVALRE